MSHFIRQHTYCTVKLPQTVTRQGRTFYQGVQLGPGNVWINGGSLRKGCEATVGTCDYSFSSDFTGISTDPLCNQFRMLDEIGG